MVAAAAVAVAVVHLRLWRARWDQPWLLDSDSIYYQFLVEGMTRHGSFWHNPEVGFPFGLHFLDQPEGGDNLHWLILRGLAGLFGTFAATNLFYVAGFGLAAAGALVAMRMLGVGRGPAAVGALLYAFLPYHFARGQVHLLLSSYGLVPLGVLVALCFMGGDPPLVRTVEGGRRRLELRSARTWWCVALMAGMGATGPYYLSFVALLIGMAAVIGAARAGDGRRLVAAAILIGVGGVVVVANNAPHFWFVARNGDNAAVVNRPRSDVETYGLRISQLFLPREDHRVPALAAIAEDARSPVLLFSEPGQQLGVAGAASLVGLLAAVAVTAAGRRGPVLARLWPLGLLAVGAMLVAAVSGFSVLLAGGLTVIRAWNRIVVVIAFLALAAGAVLVERLLARWSPRRRWLAPLVLAGIAAVGLLDQTSTSDAPDHAAAQRASSAADAFFTGWARRLGAGSPVFLAPHRIFPEGDLVHAYDGAIGYLYAPSLRWDFGAVVGRTPDYNAVLDTLAPGARLEALTALGFDAYLIDRNDEKRSPALEADAVAVLGPPVVTSSDGRWIGWDLRPLAAATRQRLGDEGVARSGALVLAGPG